MGAQPCPLGLHALWALRAAEVVGGRPRGGWPATAVRGVGCQALSLPRPPVLLSGQPGFRDPCDPGVVGAGVGTQHQPHSVRPCGPALLAVGEAEERLGGGAFHHCEGRLRSGAVPPPDCPPIRRAVGVRHPRAVGAGVWVWGPNTVPLAWKPCGGCVPRGWWGAVPGGGWPATVVRGVCCQALCLSRPPVLCLVARSQQKKKNQEKDAQPEKEKRKIDFSNLRNPPKNFTLLSGEVAKFRTLTEREEQQSRDGDEVERCLPQNT